MKVTEEFVKKNKGSRFNVYYEDGTIKKNIAFFMYSHMVCYLPSRNKRNGEVFNEYRSPNIINIEKVLPKTYDVKDNIKKFLKKIHSNAWDNLVSKYGNILSGNEPMDKVEEFLTGKVKYRRDIKKLLGDREFSLLINAFENKKSFTWSRNSYSTRGRDLSISTKLCEDGIFRAWFSSEFSGCANGDYYLLISPNIAIYYERD